MLNPEELTADLPAPRDDEPVELRGDIRDELADHLHCSMRRELLSGSHGNNENAAWDRVIERFGNPARIALECWLIKMKGKLIMQKISLIASLLAVALSAIVAWAVLNAQHQGQQANKALVEKLDELVNASKQQAPQSNEPSSWPLLRIRLVNDDKEQSPVVGQKVRADGSFLRMDEAELIEEITDKDGFVNFGRVNPGIFTLNFIRPWGAALYGYQMRVIPGYTPVTIVCPNASSYRKTQVQLNTPTDLEQEDLSYLFNVLESAGGDGVVQSTGTKQGEHTMEDFHNRLWCFFKNSTELNSYLFNSHGRLSRGSRNPAPSDLYGGNKRFYNELFLTSLDHFYVQNDSKITLDQLSVWWGSVPLQSTAFDSYGSVLIPPQNPKQSVLLPNLKDYITEDKPIVFDLKKDPSSTWKISMNDDFWTALRKELKTAKAMEAERRKNAPKTPKTEGQDQGGRFGGEGFGGGGLGGQHGGGGFGGGQPFGGGQGGLF